MIKSFPSLLPKNEWSVERNSLMTRIKLSNGVIFECEASKGYDGYFGIFQEALAYANNVYRLTGETP